MQIRAPAAAPAPTAERGPPPVSELVVTATKRRLPADRIAGAVSVIPGEQLLATRATDPERTVGQMAGVIMTNLGPGRDKLLVRGLSDGVFTGRTRATVGSYLDDAAINYDAPDPDLRLTDVERVEVVRGPQGALYGDGALAGVYRIVTRKPQLSAYAAGLSASYADTDGGSPSTAVDGYVNLPLVRDRVALRLAGYGEVQGGYLDDVLLRRTDVDKTVRNGGRAALRIAPSGEWTVDLSGAWQNLTSSDTQYTTGPLPRRRANRIAEGHQNRFFQIALTVRGRLAGADVNSSTAFVHHDFASLYDATTALGLYAAPTYELGVYEERRRVKMLTEDLVFSSPRASRLGWLVGLYAARSSEDSPSELQALPSRRPLATLYSEERRDRLSSFAAYGEVSYQFVPGWTATLGGRALRVSLNTTSSVLAPSPGLSRDFQGSSHFTRFAPKLSLEHDLGTHGLVYGLISTGYRPGGINSGGLLPLPQSRATFAPDRLRNYEIGVKWRGLGDSLTTRFAVFYDDWRDIQTDRYLPSGLAYTANVGNAEVYGLEAEAAYRFDGLSLQANLLLTHSALTRRNPDFAPRFAPGLPGVPDVSGGLLALYQRPLTAQTQMRLRAQASYVGQSLATFDAPMAQPMGGYVDAEFSAGVAARHWTADLFVSNPFNASADTFAYGNPFSFGQVRQATPQRPRTLGLVLSTHF